MLSDRVKGLETIDQDHTECNCTRFSFTAILYSTEHIIQSWVKQDNTRHRSIILYWFIHLPIFSEPIYSVCTLHRN